MTLIASDGFDLYSSFALAGWTTALSGNGLVYMVTGRTGTGQAMELDKGNGNGTTSSMTLPLGANDATLIAGTAWNNLFTIGYNPERVVGFMDAGTEQLSVRYDNVAGKLTVNRGATVLATETVASMATNVFYYLEFKVTFAGSSAGSYALRRNGQVVGGIPDNNAVTTITTANAFANQIRFGGVNGDINPGGMKYDDVYVCDGNGTLNNNFLGDVRVVGLVPDAAGTNTNWTKVGASATNWQSVSEIPPDGDTTYVKAAAVPTIDTYGYGDVPATSTSILAVNSRFDIRRDDAGIRTITTRVRTGISEADAPGSVSTTLSYALTSQIMETNPVTGVAWTVSDVNSSEFGPKILT